jgi:hypothetical protein
MVMRSAAIDATELVVSNAGTVAAELPRSALSILGMILKEECVRSSATELKLTVSAFASLVLIVSVAGTNAATQDPHAPSLPMLGTWAGTSTCVGNRPACKNENVVFRFIAIDGEPSKIRLLADKVLDGKRVPMGKLDFEVSGDRLSCEFRVNATHGVWEFTVSGDTMKGTLVDLPARDLGRRVSIRRVADNTVPPPPAIEEYG